MSDIASLLRTAQSLRANGDALVLATVVRVHGSAYRRPGARMLASEREWVAGSISGGCLERDVLQRGFFRTRTTPAVVVRHDTTADDDGASGYSLGCEGVIDVLVERLGAPMACDPLQFIAECHAEQMAGVIATVVHAEQTAARIGDRLLLPARGRHRTTLGAGAEDVARLAAQVLATGKTASRLLEEGQLEVLFEVIEPPPHLFIFGGEHDALPVARLARSLDWTVTVCEPHARVGSRTRLAGVAAYAAGTPAELAAAVKHAARPLALIMSHRYEFDRDVLKELLSIRTLYLGLLGPSRRAQRMLAELQAAGVPIDAAARQRVHAPVGLDLGAETPAEIALSAIAEAQAHLAQATGQRLRERPGAIHAA